MKRNADQGMIYEAGCHAILFGSALARGEALAGRMARAAGLAFRDVKMAIGQASKRGRAVFLSRN